MHEQIVSSYKRLFSTNDNEKNADYRNENNVAIERNMRKHSAAIEYSPYRLECWLNGCIHLSKFIKMFS